jgi:SlyX protein|tara:strand:- start:112 stop:333 length:222 start_codon:yes stop_codon:yes gene_type:complete
MNNAGDLEARLMALESHIAHQDGSIEDLHDMVNRQWTEIEALRRDIEQLRGRLLRIEGELETAQPDDQPPPHY